MVSDSDLPIRERERRRNSRPLRILIGAFLALLVVGTAVWVSAGWGLLRWTGMFRGGTTIFSVNQPAVVRQIQQLQRLETVNYTMDKIISGERDNPYLPSFLAGDRLLLVVHGEVIAGVDLGKVQPGDVSVNRRTISLRIPAAEIFSTRIDSAKTRVYSRDTGLFSSPDPNLESDVRAEAERELQQAASQDGILKTAEQNAQNTLSSLLKGFGFDQVTIQGE
jgi:Protein of unknown function (DUF4230)